VIIKLFLLAGIACAACFAYRGAPGALSLATRRLAFTGTLVAAAVAVVAPRLVTAVARLVGVGRGTDLVLYSLGLVSLFIWIGMYRRLHVMELRFVALNRAIALQESAPVEMTAAERLLPRE
jgi:hypothetical protein